MNKKLLIAALTHHDEKRLERLLKTVDFQLMHNFQVSKVVICNTLDSSYPEKAKSVAEKYQCTFVQTESNGRPGKGKNSVLDYFLTTDNDYLLMIDGDDFLYPCALESLEHFQKLGIDAVGLLTNDIVDTKFFDTYKFAKVNDDTYLYSWFDEQVQWVSLPEFESTVNVFNPLGSQTTPDRMVFFSKKAATLLRCSEELEVYEDLILSLKARALWANGQLSYINTASTYIYVYDKTNENSTCKKFDAVHNGNWSVQEEIFRKEIEHLNERLSFCEAKDIPFIKIPLCKWFKNEDKINFLKKFMEYSNKV